MKTKICGYAGLTPGCFQADWRKRARRKAEVVLEVTVGTIKRHKNKNMRLCGTDPWLDDPWLFCDPWLFPENRGGQHRKKRKMQQEKMGCIRGLAFGLVFYSLAFLERGGMGLRL
jgi:hypothetical protein